MRTSTSRAVIVTALAAVMAFSARAIAADAPAAPKSAEKAKAAPAADKKKAPAKKAAAKKAPAATDIKGAVAALSGPEVRDFRSFCDTWMGKLRDRNDFNTANVKWETRDGRVAGEHIVYATECTCIAREEPGKDPIGKITYRETRYRREGATQSEASAAAPTIVEQSDVTEIFRFAKGRWQY